jgi:N-acetylglucosamine repressor
MKPRRVKSKHRLVARLEAELLKRIRARSGLSRVELAREFHLAPSTVGIYADRLVKEGFLVEGDKAERDFGRPPTLLTLNPLAGQFIGVDFEARNVRATAVDFSQRPLKQAWRIVNRSDRTPQVLDKLEAAIAEVLPGDDLPLLGIGVGVPGTIDPARGLALEYGHISGWRNIPLAARLRERFGVPVHLENNIRSIALAELWFGLGRGTRNFICLGVRSGIGAGVVSNGQLLRGHHFQAGEIGRWTVAPPGTVSLDEAASLSALLDALRGDASGPDPGVDDLLRTFREGNPRAVGLVTEAARLHGWAAHQMHRLFDPEKIIFASPLAALGEAYLAPIRESLRQLSGDDRLPELVNSTLGDYNGALGAAALALQQWEPIREPA